MVTSKERTTGSKTGAIALLFSAAVMLFVLLFGGTASADQAADTTNAGVGGANTGVNGGVGNNSTNGATGDQTATATGGGSDAVAPNNGSTGNSSNGTSNVKTGDANATGNSATNNTQQTVVEGHNGAVVIVDQDATITNFGIGIANTGGNVAIGNNSTNDADATQNAVSGDSTDGDSVAANTAAVRNNSGGDARIDTGDASATGSTSTNTLNQTFDGNFSGLGVVVLVDQTSAVTNVGVGIANTGLNAAVGNGSTNNASNEQCALSNNGGLPCPGVPGAPAAGDSVASNDATSTNNSGGSAGIITGDANAVGNVATNNVSQVANVNAQGSLGSIVLIDQDAAVANVGISIANTGLNLAVGNLSDSTSENIQGAVSGAGPPGGDDSVASNDGTASSSSDGSASITTGDATTTGNRSTTNLTQVVDVNTDASGIVLTDQTAGVANVGIGLSNTGANAAVGNASGIFNGNLASNEQTATSTSTGNDAVAANFGSAATDSNGSASVKTGNAGSTGNASTTNLSQTVDANTDGGFALPDQEALVENIGIGASNTGLNLAIGNISDNTAAVDQTATADSAGDDAVASNFGDASATSDGSADVTTGNANSVGNDSAATTNVAQTVDTDGVNNVLTDQSVIAVDLGIGISNTGLNAAVGNGSTNEATIDDQEATVTTGAGDTVASNFGDSTTNSDGSASIKTGAADSIGNAAHTNIAQTVDAGTANGFALTDQEVLNENVGIGISNTGLNIAVGNVSDNTAAVDQTASIPAGATDDTVSANFGSAAASSDGSASITTGAANSVGNRSTTNIAQTVDADGSSFVLPDQSVEAANIGIGVSNTGGNIAIGNISGFFAPSGAFVDQDASVDATTIDGDAVASNDGTATANSDGSADITTGSANSIGNDSSHTLNITQTVDANGAGFTLVDQTAVAVNVGIGISNTGLNAAIGNASTNSAAVGPQTSTVTATGDINGDAVSSNNATSTTNSDGSATINTGAAETTGNASTTNISQTSDFDGNGFALVDQNLIDANIGIAVSNTGLNLAAGNISDNSASSDQDSSVTATGDIFGDAVSANTAASNINSDGSADITTGAAKSHGNVSTSDLSQVSDTNIDGSGFVLNDQEAEVVDLGVGISNTGLNLAVGNASPVNDATNTQVSGVSADDIGAIDDAVDVVSSNTDSTNVTSNGSASINTGFADSTGNKSTTTLDQVADSDISGSGFVLNDQIAVVVDLGIGFSNTGLNAAIGNDATSTSADTQTSSVAAAGDIFGDDIVSSNTDSNNINSDGSADITTGAARSIGNDSDHTTVVNQVSDSSIADMGFVLSDQDAEVVNAGVGIANTGLNLAAGNISTNTVEPPALADTQDSSVTSAGDIDADDVVAANTLTSETNSDGSASIKTGDAEGIGNKSTTTVNQVADNDVPDGSFVDNDQFDVVVNAGAGIGNSGLNAAIGNDSTNSVTASQVSSVDAAGAGGIEADDVVSANTANVLNNSDGSADIKTGNAGGYGNISTTTINGGDSEVLNLGLGVSNSGLNLAAGNISTNTVLIDDPAADPAIGGQDASVTGNPFTADDVVASNTATTGNNSDGSASVDTGDSTGYGNTSTTTVDSDGGDVIVVNLGLGLSNTGLNAGIGNDSTNDITADQTSDLSDVTSADDAVSNNALTGMNNSDGTVDITTGDAYALGNRSATGIVGSETAQTINLGLAFANTGLNLGAGNISTNTITDSGTASGPGGVASNVADLSNTSDGTSNIHTGNANAFGNIASNATCQGVDFGATCPQPTLPPLPPPFPCIPGSSNCPPPVNPGCTSGCTPVQPPVVNPPVLARTGANAMNELMLGLLLLAVGVFLRRKARTA